MRYRITSPCDVRFYGDWEGSSATDALARFFADGHHPCTVDDKGTIQFVNDIDRASCGDPADWIVTPVPSTRS